METLHISNLKGMITMDLDGKCLNGKLQQQKLEEIVININLK